MILTDIQPNLQGVIQGIEILAGRAVLLDDGARDSQMEAALQNDGVAILVMTPQAFGAERTRGAVAVQYTTTVWVRTNPKVLEDEVARWNPLEIEGAILNAVMRWSKQRSDYGFSLTPDMEPETDWTDEGNNSRLIRFATTINFH